jgi:hypothetical protein
MLRLDGSGACPVETASGSRRIRAATVTATVTSQLSRLRSHRGRCRSADRDSAAYRIEETPPQMIDHGRHHRAAGPGPVLWVRPDRPQRLGFGDLQRHLRIGPGPGPGPSTIELTPSLAPSRSESRDSGGDSDWVQVDVQLGPELLKSWRHSSDQRPAPRRGQIRVRVGGSSESRSRPGCQ